MTPSSARPQRTALTQISIQHDAPRHHKKQEHHHVAPADPVRLADTLHHAATVPG
jgi:hypothetical protein